MSKTRLTYLLQRYFTDAATPEEVEEFLPYLEDPEREEEIKLLMEELWKAQQPTTPVFSPAQSNAMLTGILDADAPSNAVQPPVRKMNWYYVAAALLVLVVGSLMLYNSGSNNTHNPAIATA